MMLLRPQKAETKEQSKVFDKEKIVLVKEITKLSEYKELKLEEERMQRLLRKKELKKAKQKINNEKQGKIVENKKLAPENGPSACVKNDVSLMVKRSLI